MISGDDASRKYLISDASVRLQHRQRNCRLGARTIEVKASHVSLISQPDIIANVIMEAAGCCQR
jgi:hypothetical protein